MSKIKKNNRRKNLPLFRIILRNRWGLILTSLIMGAGVNFIYQIYRQPTEILSLVYPGKSSTLEETYERYMETFHHAATPTVRPELLASIAQVESSGRVWASPPWEFKIGRGWDRIFAPSSSAFGLMQITKGHHQRVGEMCLKGRDSSSLCQDHKVWSRIFPSHSIKMASVYIEKSIKKYINNKNYPEDKLVKAAAIAHLCGEGRLDSFIAANFTFKNFKTCGSHNAVKYVNTVLDGYYKLKKSL